MRRTDPAKFAEKRSHILVAADFCFRQKGIAKTSTADICAKAGIGPGLLYHYFASKEEILDACFKEWVDGGTKEFSALMEQSNVLGALTTAIEQAKSRNFRNEFMLLLEIAAEAGRNKKVGKILQESSRRMRGVIAEFLRNGQNGGWVDASLNPDAAAALLFAMFDGIRLMAVRDPQTDLADVMDQLQIMMTRFLVAPTRKV